MTSLSFSPSPKLAPRLDRLYALWREKNEGTIPTMLFQEVVEKLAEQANHDQQWQAFLKDGEEKRGVQIAWGKSERVERVLRDADIPWDAFRAKPITDKERHALATGSPTVNEIRIPARMLDRMERYLAWAQRWVKETHPPDTPAEWRAKVYTSFEEWFHDEVEKYVDRELGKLEAEKEKEEIDTLYPELNRNREKNKPPAPAPPPRSAPPIPSRAPPTRPGDSGFIEVGGKWEPPFADRSVNPHAPHRRGPTDR